MVTSTARRPAATKPVVATVSPAAAITPVEAAVSVAHPEQLELELELDAPAPRQIIGVRVEGPGDKWRVHTIARDYGVEPGNELLLTLVDKNDVTIATYREWSAAFFVYAEPDD